jgi:hypothetical protein
MKKSKLSNSETEFIEIICAVLRLELLSSKVKFTKLNFFGKIK